MAELGQGGWQQVEVGISSRSDSRGPLSSGMSQDALKKSLSPVILRLAHAERDDGCLRGRNRQEELREGRTDRPVEGEERAKRTKYPADGWPYAKRLRQLRLKSSYLDHPSMGFIGYLPSCLSL